MRAERDEAILLYAALSLQNARHRRLQVVEAHGLEHPAPELKRKLYRFEERVLGRAWVCGVKRNPGVLRASVDDVYLGQPFRETNERFVVSTSPCAPA